MTDPNEDTSTAGLGERRRRREAERARAQAAGAGDERSLTRRERRARDEALASGALTYGPEGLVPTSEFARIEAESLSAAAAAEPPSATSAVSASSGVDPVPGTRRARREAERAAVARSAASAAEPAALRTRDEPAQRSGSATSARSAISAPSAVSGPVQDTAPILPVSRRSLRDKQAEAPPPATMGGSSSAARHTSTGRRPVVRPPASVHATRGVSAAGELTAIQRAVREANTAAEGIAFGEQAEASSPTSWHSAVDIPAVSHEVRVPPAAATAGESPEAADRGAMVRSAQVATSTSGASAPSADSADSAGSAERADSAESAESAASAESADSGPEAGAASAEEAEGAFDMTPRWESLQRTAEQPAVGRSDVQPRPSPPLRVSALRSAGTDQPPAPVDDVEPVDDTGQSEDLEQSDAEEDLLAEEDRRTPAWLFALQMLVLVLVMAVLGVLVYLYATGALFGEDSSTGPAVGHLTGWVPSR